jgi:hypothetical protein
MRPSVRTCCAVLLVVPAVAACAAGADEAPHRSGEEPRGPAAAYHESRDFAAPPELPGAMVVSGLRQLAPAVIAADWRTPAGRLRRTPGKNIDWPRAMAPDSWRVRVSSPTVPLRVVLYRYPTVGSNGIPAGDAGQEEVCEATGARCTVTRGNPGTVEIRPGAETYGYFVVQAAWLYSRDGEATVSWAFRVSRPTVVR